MVESRIFTANDVWKGGHYELFIQPSVGSSEDLCALLKALWTFPSLEGCYVRDDCEPSTQVRVQPCESSVMGHLYGLATLPNQTVVACGSYMMDYPGEEGAQAAHWVSFYMPLGALSLAYPIGAYPFGPMDKVSEWKTPVDSFLTQAAMQTYSKVPFDFALVGFEVDVSAVSPQTIRERGIPAERSDGILWNEGSELKWHPATRP
jgi:hypothetical protein